jgi:hypothetical protein
LRRRSLVLLALAAVLAGCGSSAPPAPPRAAVRLVLDTPGDLDVVRGRSVEVSGSVTPASARVLVRGEPVAVTGGRFSTQVGLDAGTNVIDVMAGAAGVRDAMAAVRVRRQVTVRVPDVVGDSPRDARDRIAGLGLSAEEVDAGGPFDALLPGDPKVCDTDPQAGKVVDAGTKIRLLIAKC